jgi:hypothetical protein
MDWTFFLQEKEAEDTLFIALLSYLMIKAFAAASLARLPMMACA